MPPPANRHLVLLHCLEQGRLGLWRSAVDLVGQDHIAKNGAFHKAEFALPRFAIVLNHLRSRDVGWHQVGRELNPAEREGQGIGQRANYQRFREAGNTN
jgi:hypothetical protein